MGSRTVTAEHAEIVHWLDSLARWDVFFTGTTRWEASCRSLKKSYEGFMAKEYGSISYVYSLEPHENHGFHVHAMFEEPFKVDWKGYWAKWFKRFGRMRTEPIKRQADVELYVTKYVIKGWEQQREEMVGDPWRDTNERNEVWWDVKISQRQFAPAAA